MVVLLTPASTRKAAVHCQVANGEETHRSQKSNIKQWLLEQGSATKGLLDLCVETRPACAATTVCTQIRD